LENNLFPAATLDYKYFQVHESMIDEWQMAYPYVTVDRELIYMKEWLKANPRKRYKNWPRFIVGWLSRGNAKAEREWVNKKTQVSVGSLAAAGRAHLSAEDLAWRKEVGIDA